MASALNVWMNGELVGVWTAARARTAFRYDAAWASSGASRALSLSLPITATLEITGEVVENYFDNLLPDSTDIRKRLTSRFATRSSTPFDLLAAIGRDCVGAVQLLPDNEAPADWARVDATPMSEDDIERHLRSVTLNEPFGAADEEDDFRISIAGAQEKTALLRIGGAWYRPHGVTPTTHILKLPLGLIGGGLDMRLSVENEWLCSRIVRELGIPIADAEIADFGSQRVLVVKRFDRRWQGLAKESAVDEPGFNPPATAWIARLPQEDFCQAKGLPPTMKYQSKGGPSIADCLALLSGSENAESDQSTFILAQLAFWLMAATDGHAKNFSIGHRRGATFSMTPLYDVLSTWPITGTGAGELLPQHAKLAMAIRGKSNHYRLKEIHVEHWRGLASSSGHSALWSRMLDMVNSVDAALDRVMAALPPDFPPALWERTSTGMRKFAEQFLREVEQAEAGGPPSA